MKTLVFGDLHGRMEWKTILQNETFDNVIFLGDYIDSHEGKHPMDFAKVLLELIKLKKELGDKCVLLYGNHDASYLNAEQCSCWSALTERLCLPLLLDMYNQNMLQPLHILDDIIFSHAGVTKTWLHKVAQTKNVQDISFPDTNLSFFDYNLLCGRDDYGDTISQSPIWVRPKSLLIDKLDNFRQIVGHTPQDNPIEKNGIFFIDAMPHYYAIVEDGDIQFKKNRF